MKIWVVLPAYNEEKHITRVLAEVKKYSKNIVVVDDFSKDETFNLALKSKVTVLKNKANKGKGRTLRKGCDYAVSKGATHLIVMDSDGQHLAKDIPRFVEALKKSDIVYGYRKFTKSMPLKFRFGNNTLNILTWLLYGVKIKDSQSGYRAFSSEAYSKIRWNAKDYAIESEMIAKASKSGLKYNQILIKTIYLEKNKGTTALDGVKILFDMIFWKVGLK